MHTTRYSATLRFSCYILDEFLDRENTDLKFTFGNILWLNPQSPRLHPQRWMSPLHLLSFLQGESMHDQHGPATLPSFLLWTWLVVRPGWHQDPGSSPLVRMRLPRKNMKTCSSYLHVPPVTVVSKRYFPLLFGPGTRSKNQSSCFHTSLRWHGDHHGTVARQIRKPHSGSHWMSTALHSTGSCFWQSSSPSSSSRSTTCCTSGSGDAAQLVWPESIRT